jgi:hypothetical protein
MTTDIYAVYEKPRKNTEVNENEPIGLHVHSKGLA